MGNSIESGTRPHGKGGQGEHELRAAQSPAAKPTAKAPTARSAGPDAWGDVIGGARARAAALDGTADPASLSSRYRTLWRRAAAAVLEPTATSGPPPLAIRASSWAEAHNILFSVDDDERESGASLGLISAEQVADIQRYCRLIGARAAPPRCERHARSCSPRAPAHAARTALIPRARAPRRHATALPRQTRTNPAR